MGGSLSGVTGDLWDLVDETLVLLKKVPAFVAAVSPFASALCVFLLNASLLALYTLVPMYMYVVEYICLCAMIDVCTALASVSSGSERQAVVRFLMEEVLHGNTHTGSYFGPRRVFEWLLDNGDLPGGITHIWKVDDAKTYAIVLERNLRHEAVDMSDLKLCRMITRFGVFPKYVCSACVVRRARNTTLLQDMWNLDTSRMRERYHVMFATNMCDVRQTVHPPSTGSKVHWKEETCDKCLVETRQALTESDQRLCRDITGVIGEYLV